jgi:hypothetical protein
MNVNEMMVDSNGNTVSDSRAQTLAIAMLSGATDATLVAIRDANRVSRTDTVVLPAYRYERLSRGRGWARCGKGDSAKWGERADGGYRVGPGKWSVGATDGYQRKGADEWSVEHVRVGQEVWTVAN